VYSFGKRYDGGLRMGPEGYLYAASNSQNIIYRIPAGGGSVEEWATVPSPWGIDFDELGNLFVVDKTNGDLYKISPDGAVTKIADLPGSNEKSFCRVFDGFVYVNEKQAGGYFRVPASAASLVDTVETIEVSPGNIVNDITFGVDGAMYVLVETGATSSLEKLSNSHQLFVSHVPWIADINQDALALAIPVKGIGVLSAGARYIDFGVQQGTILLPGSSSPTAKGWDYTGEFSPSSYQIGLGFAQKITDRFSYGLCVSYAKENLGTVYFADELTGSREQPQSKSTSLGLVNIDFGVLYYTGFRDLRIGMTLKNFSQEKSYGSVGNPIPMEMRFGLAMDLLSIFYENTEHELLLAWDLSHPRDYTERQHFGLEYVFSDFFALRMGYKTNYDEEDISFGAGLLPKFGVGGVNVGFDYAIVPFGVFDSIQVLSLTLNY